MARNTSIGWTDDSWNPIRAIDRETGKVGWFCTRVSDGCKHCYAATLNERLGNRLDYQLRNLEKIEFQLHGLAEPLRWKGSRRIFTCSMTDLFHEAIPWEMKAAVYGVMTVACNHHFQVLTKRPERAWLFYDQLSHFSSPVSACVHQASIRGVVGELGIGWWGQPLQEWPPRNIWMGVSCENQELADERIPKLKDLDASVRWLSLEPLLGPIRLSSIWLRQGVIQWVVVGGESGNGYRTMNLEWLESIVEQCNAAGVPVFVKQDSGPRPDKQGRIPDDLWKLKEWPVAPAPVGSLL